MILLQAVWPAQLTLLPLLPQTRMPLSAEMVTWLP